DALVAEYRANQRADASAQRSNLIVQKVLCVATILTFIAVAIYACITKGQLEELKQQTGILKHQTIGTMGAVIEFQNPQWLGGETGTLRMHFVNLGHVVSPNAELKFKITRYAFPSMQPFGEGTEYPEKIPQIPTTGWSKDYSIQQPSTEI